MPNGKQFMLLNCEVYVRTYIQLYSTMYVATYVDDSLSLNQIKWHDVTNLLFVLHTCMWSNTYVSTYYSKTVYANILSTCRHLQYNYENYEIVM